MSPGADPGEAPATHLGYAVGRRAPGTLAVTASRWVWIPGEAIGPYDCAVR